MTDRDALLAAIRDTPDDDAPRLIFADLLDENGYAERAEFIRLQVEMRREYTTAGVTPRLDALFIRQRRLFQKPWADVLREAGLGTISSYSRGWPTDRFDMPAERFPVLGPTLAAWFGTVPEFRLSRCAGRLGALAHIPALEAIADLTLSDAWDQMDERDVVAFADTDMARWCRAPYIARLESLELDIRYDYVDPMPFDTATHTACAALASAGFRNLRTLVLNSLPIGDAGLDLLLRGPWVADLETLHLRRTGLSSRAADLLIASALPEAMHGLFVSDNAFTNRAMARLRERFGDAVDRTPGRGEVT